MFLNYFISRFKIWVILTITHGVFYQISKGWIKYMSKLKDNEIDLIVDTYIKYKSIAKTAKETSYCMNTVNKYVMNYSKQSKHSRYKIIPIVQLDINNNYIDTYKSIADASRKLNIPQSNIAHVLRGYIKQTKGYIFKYEKEYLRKE